MTLTLTLTVTLTVTLSRSLRRRRSARATRDVHPPLLHLQPAHPALPDRRVAGNPTSPSPSRCPSPSPLTAHRSPLTPQPADAALPIGVSRASALIGEALGRADVPRAAQLLGSACLLSPALIATTLPLPLTLTLTLTAAPAALDGSHRRVRSTVSCGRGSLASLLGGGVSAVDWRSPCPDPDPNPNPNLSAWRRRERSRAECARAAADPRTGPNRNSLPNLNPPCVPPPPAPSPGVAVLLPLVLAMHVAGGTFNQPRRGSPPTAEASPPPPPPPPPPTLTLPPPPTPTPHLHPHPHPHPHPSPSRRRGSPSGRSRRSARS